MSDNNQVGIFKRKPTKPIEREPSPNHRKWHGASLMDAAVALFPVKDGFIKALSGSISALEAGLVYFAVQAVVAFIWLSRRQMQTTRTNPPLKLSTLSIFRSVFQILAIILFFYSIQNAPLAEAVVLFSSNAFFVILFSVFFREDTKLDVILKALFGFVGVIIVLGPNVFKFGNAYLLFALFSAMIFAVYLILTKKMGEKYLPNQMLFVDGIIGVCLISVCVIVSTSMGAVSAFNNLAMQYWLYLLAPGLIGTCSALLVIAVMKRAPASLTAPLGYIEIVSAFAIGVLVFNEDIYALSTIGCSFIPA